MRGGSIQRRITLWYAAAMLLSVVVTFVLVMGVARSQLRTSLATMLQNAVEDAAGEIEYEDGDLDIYDDDINYLRNDIYISVWDARLQQLGGYTPGNFSLPGEAEPGLRQVEGWLCYDIRTEVQHFGVIWVRGCVSLAGESQSFRDMYRILCLILPFLLLLALGGGAYITRRAFRPVARIAQTARQIGESGDLSKRIGLGPGRDELSRVAATFDGMLDRLEAAFEKEKRFSADASHELRTPVAVILAESECAGEPGLSAETQRALGSIHSQARKMSAIIAQLLLLSRAESSGEALQRENIELSGLLETVAEQMRDIAGERGMEIFCDIDPDVNMPADETMMLRLFVNLLDNAIRYGREDGHIWLSLKKASESVEAELRDDGPGIDEKSLPHIFERFYRGSGAKEKEGTGLGLSMAEWIVKAHGGSIRAESREGQGSCFRMRFPLS